MLNYKSTGLSVMELSHRSKEFESIIKTAEKDLRTLLHVPEDWKVLFMTGGATQQFACVPLNCLNGKSSAVYVTNGTWGEKAIAEAKKYCTPLQAFDPAPLKEKNFTSLVPQVDWTVAKDAAYMHYCDNETIMGVEYSYVPDSHGLPLICDMSSNFISRTIDYSKFSLIYAGAQKNAGPAGVTIVLVKGEYLDTLQINPQTPTVCSYKVASANGSSYNTPPCWNIYMCGLFFKHMLAQGGLEYYTKLSADKSRMLYDYIDSTAGFYNCPITLDARSRMNVVFVLQNAEMDKLFIEQAKAQGLVTLNGHKSVGGCRASLYNGMPLEGVAALVAFMKTFQSQK